MLDTDGGPAAFRDLQCTGGYRHDSGEAEWVVPVRWIATLSVADAIWENGMFGNQNTACELRNRFTLDRLDVVFGLVDAL